MDLTSVQRRLTTRWCPCTALGLLEKAPGRLHAGCGLRAPHLLRTPTRFLPSARVLTATRTPGGRWSTVSRSQLDFKSDDLVPYRVGALAIGNGEELAQTAACILGLGFGGNRRLCFNGLCRLFRRGLFFVHGDIIPRTAAAGPEGKTARFRADYCGNL